MGDIVRSSPDFFVSPRQERMQSEIPESTHAHGGILGGRESQRSHVVHVPPCCFRSRGGGRVVKEIGLSAGLLIRVRKTRPPGRMSFDFDNFGAATSSVFLLARDFFLAFLDLDICFRCGNLRLLGLERLGGWASWEHPGRERHWNRKMPSRPTRYLVSSTYLPGISGFEIELEYRTLVVTFLGLDRIS